ncbi:MAG: bifunctional 4-hydroxy-2-oxoglutarate aldolase/2-dehydro-3-deoxy-phosphogluconate aldolase [Gammaproteobacteria bacterium]|nr:bifunctional 4-hydroxy-2-oxoglutarate aldolase/2-dehydro-3-deoxy-phosphogluconate aldolase [Gammaproteobacteria bacterium]
MTLEQIMRAGPVIPVLKVDDVSIAVPLAEALVAGGLPVLEVTLRTDNALEVISAMSDVEGAIVGVGTVTRAQQFALAKQAGSRFAVTPGLSSGLIEAAPEAGMPVLPGVMTPSELITAVECGFNLLKLFPAQVAGGVAMLKSLAAPFADVGFCPTGGVSVANMTSYLELPNVICVGGSWLAPAELLAKKDWQAITALARSAVNAVGSLK